MGMIRLQTWGSFPAREFEACAEEGGHAMAIGRAMRWLASQLPEAIQRDHKLHDGGERPPQADFGRSVNEEPPERDKTV